MTAADESRSGFRVLRDRTFGRYWSGLSLASIGMWFQNLSASLLVYDLTGSTFMVGVVNFTLFAGSVLLVSVSGSVADRFDRRRVLMVTQSFAALISGSLAVVALFSEVTVPVLVAATSLLGLALAFLSPASLALVPQLVPRADLPTALSLNSVAFNLSRAIGPVAAALVIERLGYGVAFTLASTAILVFVLMLASLQPLGPPRLRPTQRPRLRDSVTFVRQTDLVVPMLAVIAMVSMSIDPVMTLAPEFAIDVFGGNERTTGLLVGSFGAGAVASALLVAPRLRHLDYILGYSLAALSASLGLFALAPVLWMACIGLALAGAAFLVTITRATIRIQDAIPDEQLGRVMALWSVCFLGSRPIAALVDGTLAEVFHPRVATAVMALLPLVMAWRIHWVVRPRLAAAREGALPTILEPDAGIAPIPPDDEEEDGDDRTGRP